ncbi:MAG: hypothetical protein JWN17_3048 [Frankiales bacterium]|nr:hypothetical protein [Frankiales bacterium]
MPAPLLVLLSVLAGALVLRARTAVALALLVGAAPLVPASLVVPFSPTPYLTVQHVLVLAGVARLVLGVAQGSVGEPELRPTRAQAALGVLLVVSGVLGVGFAVAAGPLGFAGFRLADLLDQLLYLVVALALVRQLPDLWTALRIAAGVLLCACAVAAVERVTGRSYGHFLFSRLPEQFGTDASFPLGARDGTIRVRAGAEFALQFAWLVVPLVPALVVVAVRGRRGPVLAAAATAFAGLAVYWSVSRSAVPAVVVAVVVVGLLARDRRLVALGTGAVVVAGLAYLLVPGVADRLSSSADEGAISIRFERLAPILGAASQHPLRGLGLGELVAAGYRTADQALLLEYAELGVVGVVLLVLVLVAALLQAGGALRAGGDERVVAAVCTTGVVAYVVSTGTYDAFSVLQGPHVLWFLVAVGAVAAERAGVRPRPLPAVPAVVATALVAGVLGLAAQALAPVHAATELRVTTVPLALEALAPSDVLVEGTRLLSTVCGIVTSRAVALPGVEVDCTDLHTAGGLLALRVQASTPARVRAAVAELTTGAVERVPGVELRTYVEVPVRTGRDTVWRTAPLWAPLGAVGLLLLTGTPAAAGRAMRGEPVRRRRERGGPAPTPGPGRPAGRVAAGR